MTSLMPKQDFTPEVENQEISSLMQSYYTQLSTEDLETASTLTEKMLRAYTPRHRAVVAKEIRKWLPTIDFELIQSLVDNGFKNRAAASKFRNYLIFEFVSRKELAKLSARLEEIVKERDRMDALFGVMYDMPKKQEDPIDF